MHQEGNARSWLEHQYTSGREVLLVVDGYDGQALRQQLLALQPLPAFINLYEGTYFQAWSDEAPYLIHYEKTAEPVIRTLLQETNPSWGWFTSVAHKQDMKAVAQHWQERLKVVIDGQNGLYRFSSNQVAGRALDVLEAQDIPAYLGPSISVCYFWRSTWLTVTNPSPGTHAVPVRPAWLYMPQPDQELSALLHNVRKYLYERHEDALYDLARDQDVNTWLTRLLKTALEWNWKQPVQRHFLVISSLYSPLSVDLEAWSPLPGEPPDKHFNRISTRYPLGSI